MTSTLEGSGSKEVQESGHKHLGLALVVIAAAQLMVVLDATIVNIALPSVQQALDFSAANLAWVVNGYTLAFGGLLLLGGRTGDIFGKRRMFVIGIALFSFASLVGGFATTEAWLIAARVLQGVGAAIAAPTALSLITVTFPEGPQRNRAMAVYGAMSGLGSAIGLLLGGVLTEYVSWRWVLFVNVPIGLVVIAGTSVLGEGKRLTGKIDFAGAIAGTVGLTALVYGIMRGNEEGWTESVTLTSFVIAAVVLAAFIAIESKHEHAIMPLRLFKDRNRTGAYLTMFIVGAGMFAMFYFLSLFLQKVLGYTPIEAGLAYLPFTAGIMFSVGLASKLVTMLPQRAIVGMGLVLATIGMFWQSQLTVESTYIGSLLGPMLVLSVGMGLTFIPLTLTAVSGVDSRDSGIASALLNTAQQVGGSVGLAILATVSTGAADDKLPGADAQFMAALQNGDQNLLDAALNALTNGYTAALFVGAFFMIAGLGVAFGMITAGKQQAQEEGSAPVHAG